MTGAPSQFCSTQLPCACASNPPRNRTKMEEKSNSKTKATRIQQLVMTRRVKDEQRRKLSNRRKQERHLPFMKGHKIRRSKFEEGMQEHTDNEIV